MTPTNTPRDEVLEQIEVAKVHAFEPTLEERQWILDRRAALTPQEGVELPDLDGAINRLIDADNIRPIHDYAPIIFINDIYLVTQAARLYAQGRTQAVPDGWKLVPIEPTQEMMEAIDSLPPLRQEYLPLLKKGWSHKAIAHIENWKAMLSASPAHQSQNEGE